MHNVEKYWTAHNNTAAHLKSPLLMCFVSQGVFRSLEKKK